MTAAPVPPDPLPSLSDAARSTLAVAESALLRGLAGAAGQVTPEVHVRIGRAFGVVAECVLAYVERAAESDHMLHAMVSGAETFEMFIVGETVPMDAPPELVAAIDVLASYTSAAEAIARHVAQEVMAAVAGAAGTIAAKVGVAFARTLLASFGVPVGVIPGLGA